MRDISDPRALRPGWPEIAVVLVVYATLIAFTGWWMFQIPEEQAALRGNIGMAANGAAGTIALLAAYALRIRDFRAFGFRSVDGKWLALGAILGLVAFGLSFLVEYIYFLFVTEPNTQADFQAAAKAGPAAFMVLLFAGAVMTPLGEEFVFRGVVANALNRYGAWAGVVVSSAIFATAHGPSVIFVLAFMVGFLVATLFRKTVSLWPGIVTHVVYNGLHLCYYATL